VGPEAGGGDLVVLRQWTVADAEWYAAAVTGDQVIQRFTAEPATVTAEEVRAAIAELLAGPHGAAGFLIADAVTGQRLGNIALTYKDGVGDVSYWLAGYARGRGAATEALRLFSNWAFAALRLSELRLWAHADNHGSRGVAERVGYVRDHDRDQCRQIKGQTWPTVAYVRHSFASEPAEP
jgi:ribosomal-protein-alanine N-acetyltransferase